MARRKRYNREPMPNYLREDPNGRSDEVRRWKMRQTLRRRGIENPTVNQVAKEIKKQDRERLE